MAPTYPTEAQSLAVARQSLELQRAYRTFKEPARGRAVDESILPDFTIGLDTVPVAPLPHAAISTPIPAFDWRTRVPISPPLHQGTCNACTSFAIAAAIEATFSIANPGAAIAVSPGYIHTCIGHAADSDAAKICGEGLDLYITLHTLGTSAYAQRTENDYPFVSAACPAAPLLGTVISVSDLTGPDVVLRAKQWISTRSPILADMYIWDDFTSYTTHRSPVYLPDTSTGGPWLHSVCVVGFSPAGWLIKNSYGPDWGDGMGYATIAYGACGLIGAPVPEGKVRREVFAVTV